MNFALSTGAAGGAEGAVDGLACANAPETISVLTAADIMRVFNIATSKRVCSVKESGASLRTNNSRARGLFREILELRLNHGVDLRAAAHAMRERHRLAPRADAHSEMKIFSAQLFSR
jgi:hypothetical protein